jgi:hypothetical protein
LLSNFNEIGRKENEHGIEPPISRSINDLVMRVLVLNFHDRLQRTAMSRLKERIFSPGSYILHIYRSTL